MEWIENCFRYQMLERIPRFRYLIYISYRYIIFIEYENFLNFQTCTNIRDLRVANLYHIYMSRLKTFYFIFSLHRARVSA